MKRSLRLLALLLAAAMLLSLGACSLENAAELLPQGTEEEGPAPASPEAPPAEDALSAFLRESREKGIEIEERR